MLRLSAGRQFNLLNSSKRPRCARALICPGRKRFDPGRRTLTLLSAQQAGGGGASGPVPRLHHGDNHGDGDGSSQSSWTAVSGFVFVALAAGAVLYSASTTRLEKQSNLTVSVVIPVINEASCIKQTLELVKQLEPPPLEVIVVDGGSTDATVEIALAEGATVVHSERGRAIQQNAGAATAKGDLLCFLHADTQPPSDLVQVLRKEFCQTDTVLLGFVPRIEHDGHVLWFYTLHNFLSTYYAPILFRPLSFVRGLRLLFGDQTLCCRKADFKAVGGFAKDLPIMEDADLCLRLHDAGPASGNGQRKGRVKMILDRVSVTSGRRLAAWGPWKGTVIHFKIAWRWYQGATGPELREAYDAIYTDAFR